jgi:hypothetical protein
MWAWVLAQAAPYLHALSVPTRIYYLPCTVESLLRGACWRIATPIVTPQSSKSVPCNREPTRKRLAAEGLCAVAKGEPGPGHA